MHTVIVHARVVLLFKSRSLTITCFFSLALNLTYALALLLPTFARVLLQTKSTEDNFKSNEITLILCAAPPYMSRLECIFSSKYNECNWLRSYHILDLNFAGFVHMCSMPIEINI